VEQAHNTAECCCLLPRSEVKLQLLSLPLVSSLRRLSEYLAFAAAAGYSAIHQDTKGKQVRRRGVSANGMEIVCSGWGGGLVRLAEQNSKPSYISESLHAFSSGSYT
jgi:hypothetical protein